MNPSTEEVVEIKAGAFSLTVPFTTEGLEVVRAMVRLLGAELGVGKNPITDGGGVEVEAQPNPAPETPSPQQKNAPYIQKSKFRGWEAIGRSRIGMIYKEVVNRILEEYKEGVEPENEIFSKLIQEMYGEHLTKSSIATYISAYRVYIRENKLAIKPKPPQGEDSDKTGLDASIKSLGEDLKQFKSKGKELLPIEKVAEIWGLLPNEFEYKQVKALVPVSIMQSEGRVEATNYIIKQFLSIPEFECEEPSPGVFVKSGVDEEERDGEEGGGEG